MLVDPRIDFERRGHEELHRQRTQRHGDACPGCDRLSVSSASSAVKSRHGTQPAQPPPAGELPRQPPRLLVAVDLRRAAGASACSPSSSPTTGRCSCATTGGSTSRCCVAYPETDFGGFLETEADYSDPEVQALIGEKGWMLWPPIPYSYDTRGARPARRRRRRRRRWQNWLGTDDQARDVTARLIYGFRLSVLFGLILTVLSSIVGVAAGAVQGYFGGWIDLVLQRFIEIWSGMPTLYLLIILASVVTPSFWWLLGLHAAVQLDDAGRRRARRVPARAQLRLRARRARARRRRRARSCAATCCRTR